MTYTSEKPPLPETSDQLRARIPGWGADLDPRQRPSVPKLQFNPDVTGAHWDFPERQPERWPRERSLEHAQLTPVFGTACPPKGLSGVLRKFAYRRYSEARAAHWMILLAADRIDAMESHLSSLVTRHPDNPVTDTGVLNEFESHGASSRIGKNRTDTLHPLLDPVIVAGPWIAVATLAYKGGKSAIQYASRTHRRHSSG
jgi:hypothetical protein